jgi:hypothetical protein
VADYPRWVQEAEPRRNDSLVDVWSGVHLVTGIAMGWVMDPFIALLILIAWEPLEIFVLYPLSMKLFEVPFGYESWRNSFSDIVFDAAGVALGAFALGALVDPPFFLF